MSTPPSHGSSAERTERGSVELDDVGAMVTGTGGHMISLSTEVRARLGTDIGDEVDVSITRR
jgi:hypothetical protein